MSASAPAVDLAARILKLLARRTVGEATLTQISTALDAPKSTCLRVLRTLERHDMVRVDPRSRRYSLGVYAVLLGARAEEGIDAMGTVRAMLREAAERTGLTAVYAVRTEDRMVYVAKEDPLRRHSVTVFVGNRFPIGGISIGKWVLADETAEERVRLLDGLSVPTGQELTELTAAGVLVSHGEYVPGISMTSSPLRDSDGRLVGVLAVLDTIPSLVGDAVDEVPEIIRGIAAQSFVLR